MKLILVALSVLVLSGFSSERATAAGEPSWRCECGPAVPFEGFQIYAIETVNGKESWMLLESRATQYDNAATCEAAITKEKVCQDFLLLGQ